MSTKMKETSGEKRFMFTGSDDEYRGVIQAADTAIAEWKKAHEANFGRHTLNDCCPKHAPLATYDGEGNLTLWGMYTYCIDLSRIRAYRDLVAWVRHISHKRWASAMMLGDIIDAVCEYRGWDKNITK